MTQNQLFVKRHWMDYDLCVVKNALISFILDVLLLLNATVKSRLGNTHDVKRSYARLCSSSRRTAAESIAGRVALRVILRLPAHILTGIKDLIRLQIELSSSRVAFAGWLTTTTSVENASSLNQFFNRSTTLTDLITINNRNIRITAFRRLLNVFETILV